MTENMNFTKIVEKAKSSGIHLAILNYSLSRMVPFNKPHGFKVLEIDDHHLKTMVPYRKSNFNHIKGIHACALATVSEFTTGFLLLTKLDPKKYRIILKSISMEYHYQAKMNAYGAFSISDKWMKKMVIEPMKTADRVEILCEIKIHDGEENHISTGLVTWQIKSWDKVKTKVN
jgi:hypothetical protein